MDFKLAVLFIAGAQLCAALPSPCTCQRELDPVCGSDGNTYPNVCQFLCIARTNPSLYQLHPGNCNDVPQPGLSDPNNCFCSLDYIPVCGSDGKTYRNTCHVSCKYHTGLTVAYEGECKPGVPHPNICVCGNENRPVCGSDGVTYMNDCFLNCATAHNPTLSVAAMSRCNPYLRSQ